jgi:phospholipid transport system substrate-binding protein
MKKILILLLLINLNFTNTYSIEADVFIQSTVNRAAQTLGAGLTKEERMDELKKIALDTVDIRGIGIYSLGIHGKTTNEEQKIEYMKAFENYFLQSFSSRLAEYSNPIINVDSKKKINENYTIVSSTLAGTEKRPAVKIEWRVYTKNKERPLIRDLIIEGLSLARTQKEEFNSIINSANGDIKVLLESLRNFSNN